jgi:hypothetical protein
MCEPENEEGVEGWGEGEGGEDGDDNGGCASSGGSFYDLSYENLVLLREAAVQQLLEFVELRHDDDAMAAVMSFHESNRTHLSASHAQVRHGLHTRALGSSLPFPKWRKELATAFAVHAQNL